MANKKEFRIGRRGAFMGTAIAVALLALNIGGAYLLFFGSSESEMQQQAASQPEDISSMEEESAPAEESIPEEQTAPAQAQYITLMQDYYTALSGVPCDFDFTGYGMDFNLGFEDENYRISLNAITGCEWAFFFFYDIEALQGQDYIRAVTDGVVLIPSVLTADNVTDSTGIGSAVTLMPGQEENPADGIWHCCAVVGAQGGKPLSAEGNTLTVVASCNSEEMGRLEDVPLDFLPASSELQYTDTPWYYDSVTQQFRFSGEMSADVSDGLIPIDRYALSPFGIFYISEPYPTDIAESTCGSFESGILLQRQFVQGDDVLISTDKTYCQTMNQDYETVVSVHVLFDRPLDITKGEPMLLPLPKETEPVTETPPAEDGEGIQTTAAETQIPESETNAETTVPADELMTEIPAAQIHLPADLQ